MVKGPTGPQTSFHSPAWPLPDTVEEVTDLLGGFMRALSQGKLAHSVSKQSAFPPPPLTPH